jgi:lipid-binding SYLF domain-containing protein
MRGKWILGIVAVAATTAGTCAVPAGQPALSPEQQQVSAATHSRVNDATALVRTMRHDRKLARLMARARGILLIPHYTQGGIVIGGAGGTGMLLVRRGNEWYGPAFYSLGGLNIGIQLGASAGPAAMLLMNDKAVARLENHASRWSLRTAAGLTMVKFDGEAVNSGSYGDVVVWTHLKGLYGGVSLGASNIAVDADSNRYYYHSNMTARQIMSGTARLSHSQPLHAALGAVAAAKVAAVKPAEAVKVANPPEPAKPAQAPSGK